MNGGDIREQLDEAIRRLVDEAQIRGVTVRYARAIERMDWDLLRSCYHHGAIDDHGLYAGDVDGFIELLAQRLPLDESTTHFLGNQEIELSGDLAFVETACIARYRRPASGDRPPTTTWRFYTTVIASNVAGASGASLTASSSMSPGGSIRCSPSLRTVSTTHRTSGQWRRQGCCGRMVESGRLLERRSEVPPLRARQLSTVLADDVHADVIGASGLMLANPSRHSIQIPPGYESVDQAIAAPIRKVCFGEAVSQPCVPVVRQRAVGVGEERSAEVSRACGIGVEDHGDAGGEERSGAELGPREARVAGGHDVWVRAGGACPGDLKHLWTERGDHDPTARYRSRLSLELVKVSLHCGERPPVASGVDPVEQGAVADADAKQEAIRMKIFKGVVGGGQCAGFVEPHVHDAGRHGGCPGRSQQPFDVGKDCRVRLDAAGHPDRAETELLHLCRGIGDLLRIRLT